MTTVNDDSTERMFGADKPAEIRGPIVDRRELMVPHQPHGMIVRFLRGERLRDTIIQVFQLPDASGDVFSLWSTQQLAGKLKSTRRGEVVLVRYEGQRDDDPDHVHQWTVRPFAGKAAELNTLLREAPWVTAVPKFATTVRQYRQLERETRNTRTDEGTPPHDDRDAPFGSNR